MPEKIAESYHVHTRFCDGEDTVREVAAAAAEQGIRLLGFSGHGTTPFDRSYAMSPANTRRYIAAVRAAQTRYRGKMAVLLGVERDCYGEAFPVTPEFVIGSVHYLRLPGERYVPVDESAEITRDTVNREFSGDPYAYVRAYFETVAALPFTPTVIGHFDLVAKFNEQDPLFDENDPRYRAAAFAAIDALCERGAVFEINTGAQCRGLRRAPYPAPMLLRRMREKGGRILLSSDSHRRDTLLYGLERAAMLAADCGFCSRVIILPGGDLQEVAL